MCISTWDNVVFQPASLFFLICLTTFRPHLQIVMHLEWKDIIIRSSLRGWESWYQRLWKRFITIETVYTNHRCSLWEMAEPFGIAASVVSILSLAIQLSSAVHEILKPYRSASKDIKQLEADLEAMKRTASQISNKISSNRVPGMLCITNLPGILRYWSELDDPQWDGESLHQLLENAYVRADELRNQMEFRSKNPRTYNIGRHHGSKLGIYNIGRPRGRDKGRCTEILEVNNTFSGIFMGFSALVLCATTALWKPSNIMQKVLEEEKW